MRKLLFVAVLATLTAAVIAFVGIGHARSTPADAPGAAPLPSGAFGVTIDVEPAQGEDGVYVCSAVITDLATSEVVSNPSITFRAGEPATARSGIMTGKGPADLHEVKVTIQVDPDALTASYTAEVTRAGTLLSSQRARIRLR